MRAQLYAQLQDLDQRLRHQLRERDDLLVAFGEQDVLRALYATTDQRATQLKYERGTSSDLQWELEEIELRLRALGEQEQAGPTDPLSARELALLHKQHAQLEEQVLHQLEHIAELERELQQADNEHAARAAAWAQREPVLQARLEAIGYEIEVLQTQRERVAAQLPASLLTQYDELQRRHRGTALSPIHNRQCSACRARLPAAIFDMLNDPAALVRCPRCGRVVYSDT